MNTQRNALGLLLLSLAAGPALAQSASVSSTISTGWYAGTVTAGLGPQWFGQPSVSAISQLNGHLRISTGFLAAAALEIRSSATSHSSGAQVRGPLPGLTYTIRMNGTTRESASRMFTGGTLSATKLVTNVLPGMGVTRDILFGTATVRLATNFTASGSATGAVSFGTNAQVTMTGIVKTGAVVGASTVVLDSANLVMSIYSSLDYGAHTSTTNGWLEGGWIANNGSVSCAFGSASLREELKLHNFTLPQVLIQTTAPAKTLSDSWILVWG